MDCRPDQPLTAYRIADGRRPLFDGTGASQFGARWNSPGRPVIYAAGTYAGALVEVLVHAGIGKVPRHLQWIEIFIPEGVSRECLEPDDLPGWDSDDYRASRSFGDTWLAEGRTAVLLVPSVVTRVESNVLINPSHSDFSRIVPSTASPVVWGQRLFERPS